MEYFNTFGGNPVSAEIGLAVLDVIARRAAAGRTRAATGERLLRGLRALERSLIGDVRGAGCSSASSSSLADRGRRPRGRAVKEALKARGILISTDGPDDNVLKIKPPLVISEADCDRVIAAVREALA